jgi:plastocyanin
LLNRRLTVAIAATAAVGISTAGLASTAGAATKKNQITIKGDFVFRAGKGARDNQRFKPLKAKVKSGSTVTVLNKSKTEDPHTLSFIEKAFLPTSFDAPVAEPLFGLHNLDEDDPNAVPVLKIDNGAPAADQTAPLAVDTLGTPDAPGDSLLLFGKEPVTFDVTAAAGSKLYYFCIFHPWMQGKIVVN